MWEEKEKQLTRTFELDNFKAAIAFINSIAIVAESMNHHPDIALKNYRFVEVSSTTHEKGSLTPLDHELAKKIDHLFDEI